MATLLRLGLGEVVGPDLSPYVIFYPLVMLTALLGGTGPGLLATLLSGAAVDLFFLPPAGFSVAKPADQLGLLLFCLMNVAVSLICGAFRKARHRSRTETRRAESTEERFRLFMEHTPTLAWVKDEQGRYVYVNQAYEKRFGLSRAQCQGKTDLELWPAEVAARLRQADHAALEAEHPVEVTEDTTERDGTRSFWLNTKFPFRDASRRLFIASIGLDITPRKRLEERLREQAELEQLRADAIQILQQPAATEGLLQNVAALLVERLDAAFARVWTLEVASNTLVLQASAGLYTHLNGGHSRVPVGHLKIGRIAEQRHALITNRVVDDPQISDQEWARREGMSAFAGFPLISDGRLLGVVAMFARHTLTPAAIDTFGAIAGTLAQALGRKQAEQALRESEQRFRALFETAPLSTFLIDPQTHQILDCNEQAGNALGYTRDELCRLRIPDFEAQHGPEEVARVAARIAEGEQLSFETRHRTHAGEIRDVLVTARALLLQGQQVHYATAIDITDRKRAQEALQRRNQHLHVLHQLAARLLVGDDPVAIVSDLHKAIAHALDADIFLIYQPEPGTERLTLRAYAGISDQERAKLERLRHGCAIFAQAAEAMHPLIATHVQTLEAPNCRFIRKLGFRSYLYYPLILSERLQGTLAFASRTRDDYDSTDLDFFHTVAGSLAEALERRRLQSELQRHAAHLDTLVHERTARLEETVAELEHFSYTIVHDMRAPLRAMAGFAAVLTSAHSRELKPEPRELLRRISEAALRMDHLITDALNYSGVLRAEMRLEPVEPAALLRGLIESYPQLHPPNAEISIQRDMPCVLANVAALTQVFSNLLGNAVKFVAPGTQPRIRVRAEPAGGTAGLVAAQGGDGPETIAGARVRLWVEDNGIGIEPQYHEKIWQMFQQLDKHYEGTGIGLALVRKVVERMQGKTGVESALGQGSRFWVELRRAVALGGTHG